MDILYFGMNGYNLVFPHNQFRRYEGDSYIYIERFLRAAIEAVSAIKHCTSLYNA